MLDCQKNFNCSNESPRDSAGTSNWSMGYPNLLMFHLINAGHHVTAASIKGGKHSDRSKQSVSGRKFSSGSVP